MMNKARFHGVKSDYNAFSVFYVNRLHLFSQQKKFKKHAITPIHLAYVLGHIFLILLYFFKG